MPGLPVVAAGSLLEFVLGEHDFSMPVGRISYIHVEPMSFTLHYWTTTSGGNAEIDYLVQCGSRVVPVEVKSGAAGAMKSLHHFMAKYRLEEAVRFDSNPPSMQQIHVRTTTGDVADYTLRSFPLYMAELAFRSSLAAVG